MEDIMDDEKSGLPLSKKLGIIIFVLAFVGIALAMLYGYQKYNKTTTSMEEARKDVEIVMNGDKRVITDELLISDYNVYLQSEESSKNTMLIVLGILGLIAFFVFVTSIIGFITGRINGEYGLDSVKKFLAILLSGSIVAAGMIMFIKGLGPLARTKPKTADEVSFRVAEYKVLNKTSRKFISGTEKHKSERTEYYLQLDTGTEMEVSLNIYNQVSSGTYYFGKTDTGTLFAVYPADEFCKEGE